MNKLKILLVTVLAFCAVPAFAAVDVTAIDGVAGDVALVGAAVFAILIAIAGWKLLKRVF